MLPGRVQKMSGMSRIDKILDNRRRTSGRLWKPGGRVRANPMQMLRLMAGLSPETPSSRIACEFQEMAEEPCEVKIIVFSDGTP
jgi:hypothetical protein